MLLTITNTKAPATDLGYLLYKNPSRLQSFSLAFGEAHVFYPETGAEWPSGLRCRRKPREYFSIPCEIKAFSTGLLSLKS